MGVVTRRGVGGLKTLRNRARLSRSPALVCSIRSSMTFGIAPSAIVRIWAVSLLRPPGLRPLGLPLLPAFHAIARDCFSLLSAMALQKPAGRQRHRVLWPTDPLWPDKHGGEEDVQSRKIHTNGPVRTGVVDPGGVILPRDASWVVLGLRRHCCGGASSLARSARSACNAKARSITRSRVAASR